MSEEKPLNPVLSPEALNHKWRKKDGEDKSRNWRKPTGAVAKRNFKSPIKVVRDAEQ